MSKPYPWFYTVNDRPVQIVEQPGGSTECLVLDVKTGNFVVDRSYFAYTAPGSGKDVDELSAAQFATRVATVRADLVRIYAERLCRANSKTEQDVIAAIGVPLDPPPLGATKVRTRGGDIPKIEFDLPPSVLLRGDLDARIGAPEQLPLTGPFASYVFAYDVRVSGAPYRCTVFATIDGKPAAETPVTNVLWRLDG